MRRKLRLSALLLPLLAAGAMLFSSCTDQHKYDFITLYSKTKLIALRVGMSEDEVRRTINIEHPNDSASELHAGIHFNWNEDRTQSLSFRDFGTFLVTPTGLGCYISKRADILPAYAKDTEVKIIQNDQDKIILGKQIDGVNYTMTFRFYPDDTVKYLTITNVDQYTEVESDFP